MDLVFLVFWVMMILWALLGFMWDWPGSSFRYGAVGGRLMLFILLFLLGWKVFGFSAH